MIQGLRFLVNPDVDSRDSVVRRYAPALGASGLTEKDLAATSQREGMRLLELPTFRGVRLLLFDETTRMKTGTYKSLDGCFSTALCMKHGYRQVVFSSGANAGIALTDYGGAAGLETYFFCPATTLYKLDASLFQRANAHLIAVHGSDRTVKEAARTFAHRLGAPVIPHLEWRLWSATCRGLFLAEQMQTRDSPMHWFSQSVCAAYGPIGVYRTFAALVDAGQLSARSIPKFLGIQQAGLSPMVQAWTEGRSSLPEPATWRDEAIEPSLYNVYPDQTYPLLHELLMRWGGDLRALESVEFATWQKEFVQMLSTTDIRLTTRTVNNETVYLERAGVMAGAGALKAIAEGRIKPGETVVCSLTGGAGPAPRHPAEPESWIDAGGRALAAL